MLFKPAKFKERIYQEVKRKKYYLYYLELKRVQEKRSEECLLMTVVTCIVIICK
jgi:hypothetical protein